jgi:hypothetical protein
VQIAGKYIYRGDIIWGGYPVLGYVLGITLWGLTIIIVDKENNQIIFDYKPIFCFLK